jgi:hypothetical protein
MNTPLHSLVAILVLSSPSVALTTMQGIHSVDRSFDLEQQASQPPQTKALAPAQISGHVFRADTGGPLSGVVVALSPSGGTGQRDVLQRTSVDGGYEFSGVLPGAYFLVAYRAGFVSQFYGQKEDAALTCPGSCVSVISGQKLDAIDMHLVPDPPISRMEDDALAAAFPDQRRHISFGPASFSHDGKNFAFGVGGISIGAFGQVWIYDLHSHTLTPVAQAKEESNRLLTIRDLNWGDDATLYLSALTTVGPVRPVFLAATLAGTRVIPELPNGLPTEPNSHFIVTSERLCHGCAYTLSVRRSDGSGPFEIAKIDRNFIFDADRSLVLYPKIGPILNGSIVIFDLNTHQSREIVLPVAAQALLGQRHDGTGYLVAYVAVGSCEPDSSPLGENNWIKMLLNVELRRQVFIPRVCFVKLP